MKQLIQALCHPIVVFSLGYLIGIVVGRIV